MKELQIKKYYELEEVEENGGCIMVWLDAHEEKFSFVRGDAWQELAYATINKYIHKMQYIKRFKYSYDYTGLRSIAIKEENGMRLFFYLK